MQNGQAGEASRFEHATTPPWPSPNSLLVAQSFMLCMAQHAGSHHKCQERSKAYLQCRMDKCVVRRFVPKLSRTSTIWACPCRGLMEQEDLNTLGFQHQVVVSKEEVKQDSGECEASGPVLPVVSCAVLRRRWRGCCWAELSQEEEELHVRVGLLAQLA